VFTGEAGRILAGFARIERFSAQKRVTLRLTRWNSSKSRVVYRSNNNANANGGVSYSNANNDASNSNANVGSRLNNNRRYLIGVQQRGRVPNVVPRGMSLSNSGYMPER